MMNKKVIAVCSFVSLVGFFQVDASKPRSKEMTTLIKTYNRYSTAVLEADKLNKTDETSFETTNELLVKNGYEPLKTWEDGKTKITETKTAIETEKSKGENADKEKLAENEKQLEMLKSTMEEVEKRLKAMNNLNLKKWADDLTAARADVDALSGKKKDEAKDDDQTNNEEEDEGLDNPPDVENPEGEEDA